MPLEGSVVGITGASGFIGSSLVPLLVSEGYQLRILCRDLRQDLPGITYIQGDIRSERSVHGFAKGCAAIIHLAGIAHTSLKSKSEMDEAEQVNLGGTQNVLSAAQNENVSRVVLASSAHVYAGQEGLGLKEDSPTAGDSFYARTKLMMEKVALQAARSRRFTVIIVRPCLTYGPHARFNLASLMRAIRSHFYFHVRGANPIRSLLSVGNAAAALTHLLSAGENGQIYNLADRAPVPLVEFVDSLADFMGVAKPQQLPRLVILAAIAATKPLEWAGVALPINAESLRKLTVSFTLNVEALANTGFQWQDDGLITRRRMVDAYLERAR